MEVKLLDLKREYDQLKDEIDSILLKVISETRYINGPQVKELEDSIAKYVDSKFAIGVASGTDALLVALRAAGVGEGDEVITVPYTFFATAGTVYNLGAKPVFVDISETDFNINVNKIEAAITEKTKAIVAVHLFGQCADMNRIMEIANKHNLVVIEDAAQAISSKYHNKMAGTIGHLGCYSFYPSKNLGCAGDGGMIVTNDPELNDKVRKLKNHGASPKYYHKMVGYNSRLDTIQAAILLAKLPYLDEWSKTRRANADYYDQRFSDLDLITPVRNENSYHIFNQYTIRVADRDELCQYLSENKIGNEIYYPLTLHLQECFNYLGYSQGDFPVSEKCALEALSIPIYPALRVDEREFTADTIINFYK